MKRRIDKELNDLYAAEPGLNTLRSTLDREVRPVDCGHRVVPAPTLEELDGQEDDG